MQMGPKDARIRQRMRQSNRKSKHNSSTQFRHAMNVYPSLLTWEQPPPGDVLLCAYEVFGGGGNPFRAFAIFQRGSLARVPTARVLAFPPGHFLACMGKRSHNMASSRNLTQSDYRD